MSNMRENYLCGIPEWNSEDGYDIQVMILELITAFIVKLNFYL